MIITCISDLHGHYPILQGGDLLIVAGDCTSHDTTRDWTKFFGWFLKLPYKKRILIGGNHDNFLTQCANTEDAKELGLWSGEEYDYLCDSGTEFEGLKIWGSPWTKKFQGMNPKCMAFTVEDDEELAEKWGKIPQDLDILVTHCPPYGIMDGVHKYISVSKGPTQEHFGSTSLLKKTLEIKPKLHVFGHIHESYGKSEIEFPDKTRIFVNASHVNELYDPVNEPIRIEL